MSMSAANAHGFLVNDVAGIAAVPDIISDFCFFKSADGSGTGHRILIGSQNSSPVINSRDSVAIALDGSNQPSSFVRTGAALGESAVPYPFWQPAQQGKWSVLAHWVKLSDSPSDGNSIFARGGASPVAPTLGSSPLGNISAYTGTTMNNFFVHSSRTKFNDGSGADAISDLQIAYVCRLYGYKITVDDVEGLRSGTLAPEDVGAGQYTRRLLWRLRNSSDGLVDVDNGVTLVPYGAGETPTWFPSDNPPVAVSTGPTIITGPTGAPGAASITHTARELQNVLGAWTTTGTGAWSLTGTDAAILTMTDGVVTLTSGNLDFETKSSYSFDVLSGSTTQAVTLNVTNVPEPSALTSATPSANTLLPGFTIDVVSGTAHCVCIASNTGAPSAPNVAQVKAGQNALGTTAGVVSPADLTITSAGAKTFAPVTATVGQVYYPFIVVESGGVDSVVAAGPPMYPGTGRPALGVAASGGWAALTGTDLGAAINEDAPGSDANYISTPALTSSWVFRDFPLTQNYPAGNYNNLVFRARRAGGAAVAKVELLAANDDVLATSGEQTMTDTFATFTMPNVTLAATATKLRLSAKLP